MTLNVAQNLLWREFKPDGPDKKWTSDITYTWVAGRWLCLAAVMDLFSRKIIGWSMRTSMTNELIMKALSAALASRGFPKGVVVHSDLGTQYRSNDYVDFLARNGCVHSMSRKGMCWDNGSMESFLGRLKVELIYAKNYSFLIEARAGIFAYIEVFYNRTRRHSANDYLSPVEFEERAAKAAS